MPRSKPPRSRATLGHNAEGSTADLPEEVFLSDRQLAARWGCSPRTLRNQRWRREGCEFVRLGRLVRYRMSDVLDFEARGRIS
jgi:hypothetical protein